MPKLEPSRLLTTFILAAGLVLTACGGEQSLEEPEPETPGETSPAASASEAVEEPAPEPEAVEPTPTGPMADGRPAAPSPYMEDFPSQPVTASVGDEVIAGFPDGSALGIYVGEVSAVEDGKATIEAYAKLENMPGELIYPRPAADPPAEGELAVGIADTSFFEGRVARVRDDGKVVINYTTGVEGDVSEKTLDHAFPPVEGLNPLALITYQKGGKQHKGVLVGLSGDQALYKDAARGGLTGSVDSIARRELRADWTPGAEVRVFNFGIGYTDGTVVSNDGDGFYTVKTKIFSEEEEKVYYFTEIIAR